jgi:hypothetical protein
MGRWSSPRYQGCGHQELEGHGYEKGGMARTSVEGQGAPWAVEPVMMMNSEEWNSVKKHFSLSSEAI